MKALKAALMSVLFWMGCSAKEDPKTIAEPARSQTPQAWVANGAALLDVRSPQEFGRGHLQGAVNIPVGELSARLAEVNAPRVVVYCASGIRSRRAAKMLKKAGKLVMDIKSMRGWR